MVEDGGGSCHIGFDVSPAEVSWRRGEAKQTARKVSYQVVASLCSPVCRLRGYDVGFRGELTRESQRWKTGAARMDQQAASPKASNALGRSGRLAPAFLRTAEPPPQPGSIPGPEQYRPSPRQPPPTICLCLAGSRGVMPRGVSSGACRPHGALQPDKVLGRMACICRCPVWQRPSRS